MEKSFEVKSGVMVCTDPCYTIDPPIWCMGIIENVKNGTWVASIETSDEGQWGERIATLEVRHADFKDTNLKFVDELPFTGGVDSGQFGFFDKEFYRNDESAKDLPKYGFGNEFDKESGDIWYRACCDLTLGKEQWGVLPNGVVSSSGYGDGSYGVYGERNAEGEYIAFKVVFIWGDEGDEFDDEGDVCGVCNNECFDCECDSE
jgi:hypothetical protein